MKTVKKSVRTAIALFAMALMLVVPAVNAQAAEKLSLKSIFSAEYYAQQNPDVVAVLGSDEEVLYQHFLEYGLSEGRDVSPIVDIKAYRNSNPDLLELYGDDWAGLLNHFVEYGIYETAAGTRPAVGVRFNPVAYLEAHPEAELLTGGDLLKVAELFISEGMPAGEWADAAITGGEEYVESSDYVAPAPETTAPEINEDWSTGDDTTVSSGDGGGQTGTTEPAKPSVPSCETTHASLICGTRCETCGYIADHDFGASGTEPYCLKCNANYVQINGCAHTEWHGGLCVACQKVDLYYQLHESYHVGETCPTCGYKGTVKYEADKCPGHDYGDGTTCVKCGSVKPEPEPEVPLVVETPKEEDTNGVDVLAADDIVIIEETADAEEIEAVEVADTETEEEPEADAEDTDDETAEVVDESDTENTEKIVEFEVGDTDVEVDTDGAAEVEAGVEVFAAEAA